MKRSTLILLILAIGMGTAVYYLEYKPGKPRDAGNEEAATSKPAWDIKQDDISGIEIRRGGETLQFALDGDKWQLRQPLAAVANDAAMRSLAGDLAGMTIEREFPAAAENLPGYGLATPVLRIEFRLKSGQSRVIELGGKDVLGSAAYARIDGGANVALISSSLLTSAGKTLSEFRDRTLFGGTITDLGRIRLVNGAGTFELEQKNGVWSIVAPYIAEAEESEVTGLISTLTTAEATEIVAETDAEAAKFGLTSPGLKLIATLSSGAERSISIGSKVGEDYYARVSDKPQIFKVSPSFQEKMKTKLSQLKSRLLVKMNRDELKGIQIKNVNLTLFAERGSDGKWLIRQPAEKKDQEASAFRIIDPFETRATEIVDQPTAAIITSLAKPAVEARLTDRAGKVTVVRVSAAKDGNAYVRIEGRADIYKVPESFVESLNFKLDEVTTPPASQEPIGQE